MRGVLCLSACARSDISEPLADRGGVLCLSACARSNISMPSQPTAARASLESIVLVPVLLLQKN